ncbi:nitrogen fixation protein FixH [Spirosoma sp. KCTC 42546]|uniref:FixH family protein n=1 Tax=Spirosoma sp. KCTC 42546 TaxID=2520506 RepID=UPI00115B990F|nr:FixH family protein [Spirosoma sp. KCTC 42546]QDK82172.1 nitrogen fixation protein FixH [Spirosoma sp. KCTC 42546]
MNWGKSIVLVFIVFAGFIGTMVYLMTRERIDLVSDNYYQNEIDYQQQIDRVRNARQIQAGTSTATTMTYLADQHQVVVVLPNVLQKGEITFYRPGDSRQDFRVPIAAKHPTQQLIPTQSLAKGNWRVQFTWSDGQREYYKEEQIFI